MTVVRPTINSACGDLYGQFSRKIAGMSVVYIVNSNVSPASAITTPKMV